MSYKLLIYILVSSSDKCELLHYISKRVCQFCKLWMTFTTAYTQIFFHYFTQWHKVHIWTLPTFVGVNTPYKIVNDSVWRKFSTVDGCIVYHIRIEEYLERSV